MGKHWRAHLALLGMVFIWGINFSVAKIALQEVSPLAFNAARFPMAAVLLFVILKARGQLRFPDRNEWPRVIFIGLLGNMLYQMFFILGLDRTSAGNASLLLAGTPIITALMSSAIGHERPRAGTWFGLACTFAGIVLIVLNGSGAAHGSGNGLHGSGHALVGDLLMLGASLTWATYTVGARPLIDRHGSVRVTAWTLWVGTVGIVIAGFPAVMNTSWERLSGGAWASIAYAGVLSIGLAYMIWYYGVGVLGNTRTSTYSNLTPIVAVLSAWVMLGDRPKLLQVLGAAVIIGGVTIAQATRAAHAAQAARALPEG